MNGMNQDQDEKLVTLVAAGFCVNDVMPLHQQLIEKCGEEKGGRLFGVVSKTLCLVAEIESRKPFNTRNMPMTIFNDVVGHLCGRLDSCPSSMDANDYEGCLRDLEDKQRKFMTVWETQAIQQRQRERHALH